MLKFLEKEKELNNFDYIFAIFMVIALPLLFLRSGESATIAKNPEIKNKINPFKNLDLEAKAVYVFDTKTDGVFYEKNQEAQLPLASLAKIMTGVVALSIMPEFSIINIENEYLAPEGDSGLFPNEKWTLGNLLNLILLESSNDGAYAVASVVGAYRLGGNSTNPESQKEFISIMNKKAKDLDLTQTYFLNETGLDISQSLSGAYGSARDAAKLIAFAYKNYPSVFDSTKYDTLPTESLNETKHEVKNTNKSINDFPVLLASKTGYTDLAGGNLAIIFDAGFARPIAVAILGSTEEGRFTDAEKLVWATLEYLQGN